MPYAKLLARSQRSVNAVLALFTVLTRR